MEFTDVIILIIGIKLIGIGFLVKAAPEMIAGYNKMPAAKKKNIDVKGLSSFMRNGLIIIGLLTIAGYFGFKSLGYPEIAGYSILLTIMGGSAIVVIGAK